MSQSSDPDKREATDPPRAQQEATPVADPDDGGAIEGAEVVKPGQMPSDLETQGPAATRQNAVVQPSDSANPKRPLIIAGAVVAVIVVLVLIALVT